MKTGMYRLCAALVSGVAMTLFVSCNDTGTGQDAPVARQGGGKVDDRSLAMPAIAESYTIVPLGGIFAVNDFGYIDLAGFGGGGGDGLTYAFNNNAIECFRAAMDVDFGGANRFLKLDAKDFGGFSQTDMIIQKNIGNHTVTPMFRFIPPGVAPMYDLEVYNGAMQVVAQANVPNATPVIVQPDSCCPVKVYSIAVWARPATGQYLWEVEFGPCCVVRFVLPNGIVVIADRLRFTEKNAMGVYPWFPIQFIDLTGTVNSVKKLIAVGF